MPVQRATDPPSLFRIGRHPDPLTWPPVEGHGRYGDPTLRRSTLYATVERRTAFLETLDQFRTSVSTLARAQALGRGEAGDSIPPAGNISSAYLDRVIVQFGLSPDQLWLDLRAPETLGFFEG